MVKQERTVIHIEFASKHYYFGSLKAMTDQFPKEKIGIEYSSLRNYKLSDIKPYTNAKCIIRKGVLKTVEGGRGKHLEKNE